MTMKSPPDSPHRHAVIAGASLAGLCAARVLSQSDHFDRVSILDLDELGDSDEPRRGVGQGHHSHVLLHAGLEAIERLFPGLTDELDDFGAGLVDAGAEMRWYQSGRWRPRFDSDVQLFWCERARLESAIRRRLSAEEGLEIVDRRKVVDFLGSDDGDAVGGVRAEVVGENQIQEWPAELVVDAMGRGTRTPGFLDDFGVDSFETERCDVDLSYSSFKTTYPDDYDGTWKTLVVYPTIPEQSKMGLCYPVDDERFHVTLGGWCGDAPPTDGEGVAQFARNLGHPALADVIDDSERVSKIHRFRVPEARWRRYDRVDNWPTGLICVGDAVCNFNPVYGQGMTVCAKAAEELEEMLQQATRPKGQAPLFDGRRARSFQQTVASIVHTPWLMAASQDQLYPDVSGVSGLPAHAGFMVKHIVDTSCHHESVHQAFLEVLSLKSSPLRFLSPQVAPRLATHAVSRAVQGLMPQG